jgi:two-component system OmpR family response regulator
MQILLIEDDFKIAEFVSKGLKEAGFTVSHAADGIEGWNAVSMQGFDAAIVDIMLPGMDGITLIEKMREQKIKTPVLILSAKRSVDDRVRGLQKGGDDYLTKPFAFAELLARIQSIIRRASLVTSPTTLTVEDLSLNIITHEVFRGDQKIELQPKEFALLKYLMINAGKVVSKTMIMERIWEYDFMPGTNVVEVRMCKLREKIDKNFEIKLIQTVRGAGYVIKKNL